MPYITELQDTCNPRGSAASNPFCPTDNQPLQGQLLALSGQVNGPRILLQWTGCACLDQVFREHVTPTGTPAAEPTPFRTNRGPKEQSSHPPEFWLERASEFDHTDGPGSISHWPLPIPMGQLPLLLPALPLERNLGSSTAWVQGSPVPTLGRKGRDYKGHVQGPELLRALWSVPQGTRWCHHPVLRLCKSAPPHLPHWRQQHLPCCSLPRFMLCTHKVPGCLFTVGPWAALVFTSV